MDLDTWWGLLEAEAKENIFAFLHQADRAHNGGSDAERDCKHKFQLTDAQYDYVFDLATGRHAGR